ncbi:MAG: substrate-binding domain-containing protein [Gammaproteobacteria bacterium]|uniref:LacI family DNA-binding transcriptional regulator n=1 Tax=Halomonas sp. BN3-1 TaxID=2082393 RepID=UPI000D352CE6|nr:LacI family DNA-binding transcriptional regulator [Halomonas sp. BN3-1]MBR9878759.1 substrate-binding domain-containing protein [Gammaproteobacteria bacterium]
MKQRPAVTSKEVARLAGVSQSAVSRCFSPNASISEKTREKVLRAAQELGYRPNTVARSLIMRSTRTIALVLSSLDNMFYPMAVQMASRRFQDEGYHLLLFVVPESDDFPGVMDRILQSQVDGILMLSALLTSSLARECVNAGVPLVLLNRSVDIEGIGQVYSDNYHGGYWAGSYLAMGGHRNIAFVAGVERSSTSRRRFEGFVDGLAAHGLKPHAVVHGDYDFEMARQQTRRLFAETVVPDAIFAASDHMAVAVLETLRHELGKRVPEDVSVIGFDDTPVSAWPSYSLTTVRQPIDQMIEVATSLLMRQIHEGGGAESRVLPVIPVLRETARRPDSA